MSAAVVPTLSCYLGQREWKNTKRGSRLSSLPNSMFLADRRANTDTYQVDSMACLCWMKHLRGNGQEVICIP